MGSLQRQEADLWFAEQAMEQAATKMRQATEEYARAKARYVEAYKAARGGKAPDLAQD